MGYTQAWIESRAVPAEQLRDALQEERLRLWEVVEAVNALGVDGCDARRPEELVACLEEVKSSLEAEEERRTEDSQEKETEHDEEVQKLQKQIDELAGDLAKAEAELEARDPDENLKALELLRADLARERERREEAEAIVALYRAKRTKKRGGGS